MIEDHYKAKILPAAVHLKTADGSSLSSPGEATLHLHIANFKYSHTSIIYDKLPLVVGSLSTGDLSVFTGTNSSTLAIPILCLL